MFEPSRKVVWYGQLETASAKTPVIYDPGLPEPPRGQIYLYNAERDAVLRYVLHIVQPLLKNLDGTDRVQVEKGLSKKWRSARKNFLREYGSNGMPQTRKKTTAKPSETLLEQETDASNDDDWTSDYDDFDSD